MICQAMPGCSARKGWNSQAVKSMHFTSVGGHRRRPEAALRQERDLTEPVARRSADLPRLHLWTGGSSLVICWTGLPVPPSRDGEGEEVGVEQLRSRSVDGVSDEEVADDLARARSSRRRGPVHRESARVRSAAPTRDRGPRRSARVAELLRERQRPPTAARQAGVHRHWDTKRSTIDVTAVRTAASSTERERLPCLGRIGVQDPGMGLIPAWALTISPRPQNVISRRTAGSEPAAR